MKKGRYLCGPSSILRDFTFAILLELFALPAYLNWQVCVTFTRKQFNLDQPGLYSFLKVAQRERCHNSRRFPISSQS
jgi:hypothetical protein